MKSRPPILLCSLGLAVATAVLAAGCSRRPPATRPTGAPLRIVSFSPAITQILFDMGLGEQVVGVTRFAVLPPGVQRPRLGDAKDATAEAILAVRPDLILAQTSPSKFQGVRDIDPHVRVVELTLERLADIPATIDRIGRITGRQDLARRARQRFADRLDAIRRRAAGLPRPRVIFVMGTDRPTAIGSDNFVADLIELCGGVNAGADIPGPTRWRTTTIEAIIKAAPDVLICQLTRGGSAAEAGRYWRQWHDLPAARNGRVYVVTDPQWTIPSTGLADVAAEMFRMIHPDARPPGAHGTQPVGIEQGDASVLAEAGP